MVAMPESMAYFPAWMDSTLEIGDVDLIQRMGTGDSEALSIFQRRHIGIIYSTAHRVLNNDTDAEDVVLPHDLPDDGGKVSGEIISTS